MLFKEKLTILYMLNKSFFSKTSLNLLLFLAISIFSSKIIFAQDADNDGIIDLLENAIADGDSDTLANSNDIDSDNDGIADNIEYGVDISGVNFANDSDNDGIPDDMDASSGGIDANENGIIDTFDPIDTDGDGVFDYLDLDSDNDGMFDLVEAGFFSLDPDLNGRIAIDNTNDNNSDGQVDSTSSSTPPNTVETTPANFINVDSDGDGCPDALEAGGSFSPDDLDSDNSLGDLVNSAGVLNIAPSGQPITSAVTKNFETGICDAFIDTDNDGIVDIDDLDDDNDGIPDEEEGICDQVNTFDVSSEGWFTINDNDNNKIQSDPASHSRDSKTSSVKCNINTTGLANMSIAGASPTGTDYIVDADPNDGINYLRSPDFGGIDLSNLLGGQVEYDAYNYKVGETGDPGWITETSESDRKARVFLFDTNGNSVSSIFDLTPEQLTNWENGFWNTIKVPLVEANWSGSSPSVDLESVLSNYSYISIRMEFIFAGNTQDCNSTEYYAIDNVGLSNLSGGNATCDFDNDGIPNSLDLDSDNDGILDVYEAGGTDENGDGIIDDFTDIDMDGLNDAQDNINNGGANEVTTGTPLPITNTDGSGAPDYIDIDADDDGIVDNIEGQYTNLYQPPLNADDDNDGIDNQYDIDFTGNNSFSAVDTDGDNLDDYRDLNSDNDMFSDLIEGWDTDANGTAETTPLNVDIDGDGLDDAFDNDLTTFNPTNGQVPTDFPDAQLPGDDRDWRQSLDNDNDGIVDTIDLDDDNDGIPDSEEGNGDSDGDGIKDSFDLDSDNDGIADVTEAGGNDENGDGLLDDFVDADNDGLHDAVDNFDNGSSQEVTNGTPLENPDSDNDGVDDRIDIDSDNDGLPDNIEAQTTADYIPPTGISTPNGFDSAYPTALTPENTDNTDEPDYLDTDSDNDGINDVIEGERGTFQGVDTDGDGLDDGFEGSEINDPNDTNDEIDDPTLLPDMQMPGGDVDYRQGVDSDGDGVTDSQETTDGTDPNDPCDFLIASITEPQSGNWWTADCDGDGVTNGQETDDNTNPEDPCEADAASITLAQSGDYLIADCDGDGVTNNQEIIDSTNPNDPCDFSEASISLATSGDWLTADCDNDTIANGQEITDNTDPYDPCSSIGGTPPAGANCEIEIQVESDLVSPDLNDGIFKITNIELVPNNAVKIYNRWGILVFETQGYDNNNNAFRGESTGRATLQAAEKLPVGVYYYVIDYVQNGDSTTLSGYLYINR